MTAPLAAPAAPADDLRHQFAALTRSCLRSSLVGKVDLSGVVQETLLDAHAAGDKVPAADPGRGRTWLATVFRRNLIDTVRRMTAACRDVRRDIPLDPRPGSGAALADRLPADGSTPSGRASRTEEAARLARALTALRPDQRQAVELRYLHGRSVGEIAAALGKNKEAVAGLLKRGLEHLRGLLTDPDAAG